MPLPKHILIVEDDDDDYFFTSRTLKKACDAQLQRVNNGGEAIQYLMGLGEFAEREKFPVPDLILLDLKMDGVTGHEFLKWSRDHFQGRTFDLFILTGSGELRDRELVRQSGMASGYFVKPLELRDTEKLFQRFESDHGFASGRVMKSAISEELSLRLRSMLKMNTGT